MEKTREMMKMMITKQAPGCEFNLLEYEKTGTSYFSVSRLRTMLGLYYPDSSPYYTTI